ncbi:hypothetical protein CHUAL_002486 [Chamberlinius hualienensis]
MEVSRHGRRWRTLIACSLFLLLYSVQGFWFSTSYVQQAVRTTSVYQKWWEEKETFNMTTLNDSSTLSNLVDKSDFHFLTNHERCQSVPSVFMLIFVHSDPSHSDRRLAIRSTWGNESNLAEDNLRVIFLVGEVEDQQLQEDLTREDQLYEDIIQGNFLDTYRNLTYKHVMGLKWVSHYCRCAKYVFKTDDDIFVDIFQMVNYLKSRYGLASPPRNLMMCFIYRKAYVKRSRRSKWYVSVKEYKEHYYPTYCAGWGIIMSADVVYNLYMESFKIPYFWVDDVLVTGLLAQRIGITHTELNNKIPISQRAVTRWLASQQEQQPYLFGLPDSDIETINALWNKTLQYYNKIKR